jgi:undecaprenyl-diphosphatase
MHVCTPGETMLKLIGVLDLHDRALLARWMLDASSSWRRRRWWIRLTQLGGARVTIALAIAPALLALVLPRHAAACRALARDAALTLLVSHVAVQIVKRSILRARPQSAGTDAPDAFSFPSGHSCAAMAIALAYALHAPIVAPVVIGGALLVGHSRVALGVHFPGDVLAGQCLAVLTALAVVTP